MRELESTEIAKDNAVANPKASHDVDPNVRKSMRSNKATGTKPEIALRKALWRAGLRGYRKNVRSLPGKPDIVFGKARLAIFVHGCFWHRCPRCDKRMPVRNAAFWESKLLGNVRRDEVAAHLLRETGYEVLVIWECECRPKEIDETVSRIKRALFGL